MNRGYRVALYNHKIECLMHKISRIIVKEMAMLSNDEMAMITGGNDGTGATTTAPVYSVCGPGNLGHPCMYYVNGTYYFGTCQFSAYYDSNTSIEQYYCA